MSDDAFEREYLGGAKAIHREKIASRGTFGVLAGTAATLGAFAAIGMAAGASGDVQGWIAGGALGLLAAFVGTLSLTHSVLRILVSATEVVLHTGFSEQRIPIGAITRVVPATYDHEHRARMLREQSGTFASITPARRLVRIEWTDASGAERANYVGSLQPEVLVEAIARVQRMKSAAGPRVRVEPREESEEEAPEARRASRRARR